MQKLIADTHTHSIASDHAYSTILENIKAAQEQGLSYLAMTEHAHLAYPVPVGHSFCLLRGEYPAWGGG